MSYLKSKSWFIKKTKNRPNRFYIWNDTYQVGAYVLWPVTTELLKSEVVSVSPKSKDKDFGCNMSKGSGRFLAIGSKSFMAFFDEKPDLDIVVHECYHWMNYEMEYHAVPYKDIGNSDDSEARAYFLQWAVRETARIVKAKI